MNLSNKDKKLLVYLLAISIVAGAYFFGARIFLDKQAKLVKENEQLQLEVNHYNEINNDLDGYQNRIDESKAKYDEMTAKFFGGLDQENTLVMIDGIEKSTNVWMSRVSFTDSEVMIGGTAEEVIATDASEESSEGTETTETTSSSISGIKQDLSIDFSGSYSDFKNFLAYLNNYDQRLFISSLSASYNVDASQISGLLVLSQYAIPGAKEYTAPDLSSVGTGVENIFTSLQDTAGGIEMIPGQVSLEGEEGVEASDENVTTDEAETDGENSEAGTEESETEETPEAATPGPKPAGGVI